jgi:hypothetical protein
MPDNIILKNSDIVTDAEGEKAYWPSFVCDALRMMPIPTCMTTNARAAAYAAWSGPDGIHDSGRRQHERPMRGIAPFDGSGASPSIF